MFDSSDAKCAVHVLALVLSSGLVCLAGTHVPLPDPIPGTIPASSVEVGLREVASGMVAPEWGATAPGDDDHLYIADQTGQIYSVSVGDEKHEKRQGTKLFLDLSRRLVKLGLFGINYDERGLLGLAFHPDFRRNGLFYTFTSEVKKGKADFSTLPADVAPDCQSVITEWRVTDPDDDKGMKVDLLSEREVLRIDKPQFNHNGGALVFGPDRLLYISLGDGGNANDVGPGHVPGGNAQSLAPGNVLGKILRIDPLGRDSANGKYGIPECNPFVNGQGAPEIYAYGFRNPFRMSFDSRTGHLYAGDVGQNDIEEVDIVEKGGNYGWPIKEGTFLFDNGANRPAPDTGTGFPYLDSPGSPAGLIDPIAEYDHQDGVGAPKTRVAVIGGFVYRGHEVRELREHYVFGDYSGQLGTPANGHIFMLGKHDGPIETLKIEGRESLGLAVLGFTQDDRGELYLLASKTGVVRGRTGKVFKITRVREDEHE